MRRLNERVEAQVHGPVRPGADVEALVLDPSFAGTDVEAAAQRRGCAMELHPGVRASPDSFDPGHRGPDVVALARSLGDELTPRAIGDAARAGLSSVRSLKQVWHCLARFGRLTP